MKEIIMSDNISETEGNYQNPYNPHRERSTQKYVHEAPKGLHTKMEKVVNHAKEIKEKTDVVPSKPKSSLKKQILRIGTALGVMAGMTAATVEVARNQLMPKTKGHEIATPHDLSSDKERMINGIEQSIAQLDLLDQVNPQPDVNLNAEISFNFVVGDGEDKKVYTDKMIGVSIADRVKLHTDILLAKQNLKFAEEIINDNPDYTGFKFAFWTRRNYAFDVNVLNPNKTVDTYVVDASSTFHTEGTDAKIMDNPSDTGRPQTSGVDVTVSQVQAGQPITLLTPEQVAAMGAPQTYSFGDNFKVHYDMSPNGNVSSRFTIPNEHGRGSSEAPHDVIEFLTLNIAPKISPYEGPLINQDLTTALNSPR